MPIDVLESGSKLSVLGQGSNIANRCCNWGRFIAIPKIELKLERFQVQLLGVRYSEVEAQVPTLPTSQGSF